VTFWARGYFVSTVGLDETMVRAYKRLDIGIQSPDIADA
jgi:hypothetical protein